MISSSSYTTATGMASLLSIKHDKITQELSKENYDSKFYGKKSSPNIQELTQSKETIVLGFNPLYALESLLQLPATAKYTALLHF